MVKKWILIVKFLFLPLYAHLVYICLYAYFYVNVPHSCEMTIEVYYILFYSLFYSILISSVADICKMGKIGKSNSYSTS